MIALLTLAACAHQNQNVRTPANDGVNAAKTGGVQTYQCGVVDLTHKKDCGQATITDDTLDKKRAVAQFKCNDNTFGDNELFLVLNKEPAPDGMTTIAFGTGTYGSFGDATRLEGLGMNSPAGFKISLNLVRTATLNKIKQVYQAHCLREF
jgi:hypothetical protein